MTEAARVTTFTLESDSVTGDDWHEEVAELVGIAADCRLIGLARTTGASREAGAGTDRKAAHRRQALLQEVLEIAETGVYGVSEYGKAEYGTKDQQGTFEAIQTALWPSRTATPDRSDTNDAMHLATHLKSDRDHFVTTDRRVLAARDGLRSLGIDVLDPTQALKQARSLCTPHGRRLRRDL
jgi:hypothetical protein